MSAQARPTKMRVFGRHGFCMLTGIMTYLSVFRKFGSWITATCPLTSKGALSINVLLSCSELLLVGAARANWTRQIPARMIFHPAARRRTPRSRPPGLSMLTVLYSKRAMVLHRAVQGVVR
jgi:hypothetical protein